MLIKLAIVFGAGYFIYQRVFHSSSISFETFVNQIKVYLFKTNWIMPLLIGMTLINWFFEILKWKLLVNTIKKIAFFEAARQSLSSHTLSLFTPFKLGEYGGKALYFQKHQRNRIWLLNLGGNPIQLFMTLFFGIIGLAYFINTFEVNIHPHKLRRIVYALVMIIVLIFGGVKVTNRNQKGNYYKRLLSFLKKQSNRSLGVLISVSLLRYLIFSHQFYFLVLIFGIEIPYTTAMMLIFTMYFLATLLPTINLFDFVIKGSIAIYLFSFLNIEGISIISISMIMWLLNFALPAIIGSYYILTFKTGNKYSNNQFKTDLKGV